MPSTASTNQSQLAPSIRGIYVRWRNFRGFVDTGKTNLKPITVLLGSNNSGKSSFLAPFLLMKETLDSLDPFNGLKLVGPSIDAGTFRDIAHNHNVECPVTFDVTYHTHKHLKNHEPEPIEASSPGRLVMDFLERRDGSFVELLRYAVYDTENRLMLTRKLLESERYSISGLNRLLLSTQKRQVDKRFDREVRKYIRSDQPTNFLFTDDPFTRAIRGIDLPDSPGALSAYSSTYLSIVESVKASIDAFIENITFIGPLRRQPSRLYIETGELPRSVGPQGQDTAEMIYRWHKVTDEFTRSIEEWLQSFDFNVKLIPRRITRDAFSIELKERTKHGCSINFADAGFGISQVLPLIVQSVFANKYRQIIVTEQPEIHLNPKLQAVLADLFVSVANSGSAVLVETHSEHMVLRLRRLIAEEKITADNVGLFYIEKMMGGSHIREVPIDEFGHIEGDAWPKGFFGDALEEAFGLSTAQARRLQKNAS